MPEACNHSCLELDDLYDIARKKRASGSRLSDAKSNEGTVHLGPKDGIENARGLYEERCYNK